ncbi:MAG: hypothetical protein A3H98_13685 [Bacteroidetes bacterium RIFCSPLOWO2_02_FULL_36_8]|nr:MAG: hypothetical protein A3H98_13685 [Bacteroidetes bacterium RIFCSPLOWO2_02_FULL_36_8]OFY70871.1 MAG: hypothetical protein A3G23_12180 [Bacteroidetes bacterium RIFCSPLOWO2_12_FULL_37_12]
MDPLSAVVITQNEEANIYHCLTSLQPVADEILVIDSNSSDRTVELCKELGAKVISQNWMGYGPTKNFGNKNARHDWILSLDADEELNPELQKAIMEAKKELKGVYSFKRLNNYCKRWVRHCGWYPDIKERIFNRNESFWNEKLIHEKLISPPKTNKQLLKGDCLHYSYATEGDLLIKTEKYARLAAEEMLKKKQFIFPGVVLLKSLFRFFKGYILQVGFLDGKAGWEICRMNAHGVFLKYKYFGELKKTEANRVQKKITYNI